MSIVECRCAARKTAVISFPLENGNIYLVKICAACTTDPFFVHGMMPEKEAKSVDWKVAK